jgi:hypothetical protein
VLRGGVVVTHLAHPTEDQILEKADAERHASQAPRDKPKVME